MWRLLAELVFDETAVHFEDTFQNGLLDPCNILKKFQTITVTRLQMQIANMFTNDAQRKIKMTSKKRDNEIATGCAYQIDTRKNIGRSKQWKTWNQCFILKQSEEAAIECLSAKQIYWTYICVSNK